MALKNFFRFLFFTFLITSCAKRGTITGGPKDTIAPALLNSFPKNFNTNFKGKIIKLSFDEYVVLKDINKQLIVSPPMNTAPEIVPSSATKYINIKIKDTLKPNTTYSFNFGQSIKDNNEGNSFSQFKYVFSTGAAIDSLKVEGTIADAFEKKTDNFVSVMLYEMNDKYSDSVIYKQKPQYVTNTLDSLKSFKIENVKAGKYVLVAIHDKNNNFKLNPKTEKIGFWKDVIEIPTKENYKLKLFKEELTFKTNKPSQASGNKVIMGFDGNPKSLKVVVKNGNEIVPTVLTKIEKKDSVNIWFKKIKVDSLSFSTENESYKKSFSVKIKDQKKDTLSISSLTNSKLDLSKNYTLSSATPLSKIDVSKITLKTKDSADVKFTTNYDEFTKELKFIFKNEPEQSYKLRLKPDALIDFLDNSNKKILKFDFSTSAITDYGNLKVKLENVKQYPVIVELTDDSGAVLATQYTEKESVVNFELLEPRKYFLKIIYDSNKNKKWDTGKFLTKLQPEEVLFIYKEIDVRANWDVEQPIDCSNQIEPEKVKKVKTSN